VASSSEACSRCSNFDINAFETNLVKLEEHIKNKNKEIDRLNMLVKQGRFGAKSIPKVIDKEGLGHHKDTKVLTVSLRQPSHEFTFNIGIVLLF
jgi:hypothetical protein